MLLELAGVVHYFNSFSQTTVCEPSPVGPRAMASTDSLHQFYCALSVEKHGVIRYLPNVASTGFRRDMRREEERGEGGKQVLAVSRKHGRSSGEISEVESEHLALLPTREWLVTA